MEIHRKEEVKEVGPGGLRSGRTEMYNHKYNDLAASQCVRSDDIEPPYPVPVPSCTVGYQRTGTGPTENVYVCYYYL